MKTVVVQAQQKWEALTLTRYSETTLTISVNEAGQEGWELVNAVQYKDMKGSSCWTAFLKRPCASQVAKAAAQDSSMPVAQALEKAGPEAGGPHFELNGDGYDVKKE